MLLCLGRFHIFFSEGPKIIADQVCLYLIKYVIYVSDSIIIVLVMSLKRQA